MLISMTPNDEVKTIHASLNDDKLRKWEFEPYTEQGKIELTDQDYATIRSIKGNTVKFNQLVQNGNFADTSNWWSRNNASFTVSNNEGIFTPSIRLGRIEQFVSLIGGHKYFFKMSIKCAVNRRLQMYASDSVYYTVVNDIDVGTSYQVYNYIFALQENVADSNAVGLRDLNNDGFSQINVKNAQLFDLTAMDIDSLTTVEQVETWLSNNIGLLPYYDYTPGTLIPFKGTGLKTENASQTESNTLSLPISTYFPTGMKSAGSVYDELTESKAITRIGSRAYQSGDEDDASVITDGTTTYYALTTPTEVDISLDLSYDVWDNGTEQILPVNSGTPTTSSMKATIEYPDRTEEVNFLYKQTTFDSAIPQFSLVCKNQELPMTLEDGKLICECDSSITNESGFFDCKVKMQDLNSVAYSQKIQLHVERGIND